MHQTAGLVINAGTGVVDLVTSTPGTYTVTYSFTNGPVRILLQQPLQSTLCQLQLLLTQVHHIVLPVLQLLHRQVGCGTYTSTAGLVINAGTGAIAS